MVTKWTNELELKETERSQVSRDKTQLTYSQII